MLTILNTLKNNIQAEGCFPYVGPITLLNSNINDYPLIGIQFDQANINGNAIQYQFSIYYMEVVTPDIKPEEIQDRGIKTLLKVIKSLNYDDILFEPFIQEFSDVCTGVVMTITINGGYALC